LVEPARSAVGEADQGGPPASNSRRYPLEQAPLCAREHAPLDRLLDVLPCPGGRPLAIGRVSLWGRVVENVDGWRAEYAYPYELAVRRGDEATLAALRRAYLVDVALD